MITVNFMTLIVVAVGIGGVIVGRQLKMTVLWTIITGVSCAAIVGLISNRISYVAEVKEERTVLAESLPPVWQNFRKFVMNISRSHKVQRETAHTFLEAHEDLPMLTIDECQLFPTSIHSTLAGHIDFEGEPQ